MSQSGRLAGTRATIKDVALAAGVSPMTVSNVLNGKLQFVSDATRKRVEREIKKLNYRPRTSARNLRASQSRSVGMIIVDASPYFLVDQFTNQVVAGLANVLNRADYTLTVQGMGPQELSNSVIVRNLEVGGFCAMLSGTKEERENLKDLLASLAQPAVLIQEPGHGSDHFCSVRQDDFGGGLLIADHLLARRAQRLAVIVPRQSWPAIEFRLAGLREGLKRANASPTVRIVEAEGEDPRSVEQAIDAHLEADVPPDALIGANDRIAAAAMFHLIDRGLRVPEDVRVIGFNAFEAHMLARPRLTTVRSSPYAIGEQAGRAMLQHFTVGSFPERDHVVPVSFQPGGTS